MHPSMVAERDHIEKLCKVWPHCMDEHVDIELAFLGTVLREGNRMRVLLSIANPLDWQVHLRYQISGVLHGWLTELAHP